MGTKINPTITAARTSLPTNADRELGAHRQRITDCKIPMASPSNTYAVKPAVVSGNSNPMTEYTRETPRPYSQKARPKELLPVSGSLNHRGHTTASQR